MASAASRARPRHVRTDAFMARGDLSPKAIFSEFRGRKPPKLFGYLDNGTERICKECLQWKPREAFRGVRSEKALRWECYACSEERRKAWCAAHPDRLKAHRRSRDEHEKTIRRFANTFMGNKRKAAVKVDMDVVRKAMIQRPPELQTEEERVAFARGFMAGAQRTEAETKRFDTLKDLCHRIASDCGAYGHAYEARLAAAYEGLLAFMRKTNSGLGYQSLEHERRTAAAAIRNSLKDDARANGPRKNGGTQRYTVAHGGYVDDETDPLTLVGTIDKPAYGLEALDAFDIDPRTRDILDGLVDGRTYKEMGAKHGITESRACQLVLALRKQHPELESILLSEVS